MFAAMEAAGAAGLAPVVLFHDATKGVCVQEKLGDELAGRDALSSPRRRRTARALYAFGMQFRELALDLPRVSVFDQVTSAARPCCAITPWTCRPSRRR